MNTRHHLPKVKTPHPGVLDLCAIFLTLVVLTTPSFALPDDRAQAIKIKADSAEHDDKKGITTYTGKVEIDQGSLHISAEKIVIYGSDSVTRIIAYGTPATLQQRPQLDKGIVTASGETIEYILAVETIKLVKNARIEQDGTKVRGNEITYDMPKQIFRANGSTESDRVEMVIPPNLTTPAKNNLSTPELQTKQTKGKKRNQDNS